MPPRHGPKVDSADPSDLARSLGRTIRYLRLQQNLTVAGFSASAGISIAMTSKVENGLITPSLGLLQKLPKVLIHLSKHCLLLTKESPSAHLWSWTRAAGRSQLH